MKRIYQVFIAFCICVYIISGILNIRGIDFCSNHSNPLGTLVSFGTYTLFFIATEIEVFLNKNLTHLRRFLLFWAIQPLPVAISFFDSNLAFILFLSIAAPSIEIYSAFTGKQEFIFPIFCLIMVIQLLSILLWNKYMKRRIETVD